MRESENIVALDLGTSKIVCMLGKIENGRISIVDYIKKPSEGIIRGEVVISSKVSDTIKEVILEMEERHAIKINQIVVNTSNKYIKCENINKEFTRKLPESYITELEIRDFLNKIKEENTTNDNIILSTFPQQYNVDDNMGMSPEIAGMIGEKVQATVNIIKSSAKSIKSVNLVVDNCNKDIKVYNYYFNGLASVNAIVSGEESESGYALVDIGAGTTDVIIIKDNTVRYAAVIPFGGNSITNDIKTVFGINTKDAEKLKRLCTCVPNKAADKEIIIKDNKVTYKEISEIIEARILEIFEAVNYHIELSGCKNIIMGGLILTGGGAKLTHISMIASITTGINKIKIEAPKEAHGDNIELAEPELSTAVGLILSGGRDYLKSGKSLNMVEDLVVNIEESSKEQQDVQTNESNVETNANKEKEAAEVNNKEEKVEKGQGILKRFLSGELFGNNKA